MPTICLGESPWGRRRASGVNVHGYPHGVAVSLRGRGDAGHATHDTVSVAGCNR